MTRAISFSNRNFVAIRADSAGFNRLQDGEWKIGRNSRTAQTADGFAFHVKLTIGRIARYIARPFYRARDLCQVYRKARSGHFYSIAITSMAASFVLLLWRDFGGPPSPTRVVECFGVTKVVPVALRR